MSISCPSCKSPLRFVVYHGVQVKLCMTCKGMLLQQERLVSILESQEEISITNPAKSYPGKLSSVYYCPSCEEPMEKQDYGL